MEERLQKILAAAGVASRREAEKIITAGRVRVNGKIVTELGCKFDASKVRISVDGKPIAQEAKAYYMFYKPRGVVTTMSDPQNRRSIADFVQNLPERVFPVGRLDFNTEGLLLLTNDGALAQALMHPSHEVNKTYLVKVPGIVPQEKLDQLRLGVKLEDGPTAPAIVNLRDYDHERGFTLFDITIHEPPDSPHVRRYRLPGARFEAYQAGTAAAEQSGTRQVPQPERAGIISAQKGG